MASSPFFSLYSIYLVGIFWFIVHGYGNLIKSFGRWTRRYHLSWDHCWSTCGMCWPNLREPSEASLCRARWTRENQEKTTRKNSQCTRLNPRFKDNIACSTDSESHLSHLLPSMRPHDSCVHATAAESAGLGFTIFHNNPSFLSDLCFCDNHVGMVRQPYLCICILWDVTIIWNHWLQI